MNLHIIHNTMIGKFFLYRYYCSFCLKNIQIICISLYWDPAWFLDSMVAHLGLRNHDLLYDGIGNIMAEILSA